MIVINTLKLESDKILDEIKIIESDCILLAGQNKKTDFLELEMKKLTRKYLKLTR